MGVLFGDVGIDGSELERGRIWMVGWWLITNGVSGAGDGR